MTGASITYGIRDVTRLSPRVQRFLRRATDKPVLLAGIGEEVVTSTKRRFEESKAPDGTAWAAVARGGKPLVDSGLTGDSIHYRVGGDSVRVGTNKVQAALHQFGGTVKPKTAKVLAFTVNGEAVFARAVTIKARPFLGINDEDRGDIRGAVADFIRMARKAG